jgi:hypothetical protein
MLICVLFFALRLFVVEWENQSLPSKQGCSAAIKHLEEVSKVVLSYIRMPRCR